MSKPKNGAFKRYCLRRYKRVKNTDDFNIRKRNLETASAHKAGISKVCAVEVDNMCVEC